MLKLTSRFVLQVLPYLLMALAVIVLLPVVANSLMGAAIPAAASSPSHELEMPLGHGKTTLDLIHQDHEAFASNGLLREIVVAEVDLKRH